MQERLLSHHSASAGYRQTGRHWLMAGSKADGTKCQASQPLSGYDRDLPSNYLAMVDGSHLGSSIELLAESKQSLMEGSGHNGPSSTEERDNSPFLERTGCLGEFLRGLEFYAYPSILPKGIVFP